MAIMPVLLDTADTAETLDNFTQASSNAERSDIAERMAEILASLLDQVAGEIDDTCLNCGKKVYQDSGGAIVDYATSGDVCGVQGGNEPHVM